MSSDESFLWTNTSDSDSDDSASSDMKIKHKEGDVKEKPCEENKKEESYSGTKSNKQVKKKNIKDEPVSDVDNKTLIDVDEKMKYEEHDFYNNDNDDSYLNMKVKEEQLSNLEDSDMQKKQKKKKKRKHSITESNHIDIKSPDVSFNQNEDLSSNVNDDQIQVLEDDYHVKSKKNKKKHKNSVKLNNKTELTENNISDSIKKYEEKKEVIDESNLHNHTNDESNFSKISMQKENLSKIADQIMFEEDACDGDLNRSDKNMKINNENTKIKQKQVRHYLKKNRNLQPILFKTQTDSIITDNDDVWLLKCPHDVDIMQFKGLTLSASNKKKIKIDGKVFEQIVEHNEERLSILTFNEQKTIIKTFKSNGCINLRNKVPKINIPNNEVIVDDQNSFIPLPETKCRHPLFGLHYKKLIKVPSNISQRLHIDKTTKAVELNPIKEKKRKQIREQYVESEDHIKTKKGDKKQTKKRKLSSGDNISTKSKRVKYDPDSVQIWDSVKAIEENLFNF